MKNKDLSIRRQCRLLSLNRSSLYYDAKEENPVNVMLMNVIDQQYTRTPYYGIRRMTEALRLNGFHVNRKRVGRLMRKMGLEAIYPKPKLSKKNPEHRVYPYLLKGVNIHRPNQVWSTDITYIPMAQGFAYLIAIMDWYSRYVLSWRVSTSLDTGFCIEALQEALAGYSNPEIVNSDQGCQFTSQGWLTPLETSGIKISMDGKGRFLDNIFVERLWRTVKYEDLYIKRYESVKEVKAGLQEYFKHYNNERLHQSLDYRTPAQVYFQLESPEKAGNGNFLKVDVKKPLKSKISNSFLTTLISITTTF